MFVASIFVCQTLLVFSAKSVLCQTFPFSSTNVRSIDGSDRADNHGKAHENLARILPAKYPDNVGTTIESTYNPRSISNLVSAQSAQILNDRSLNAMVWQFGQLLDHDIGLTEGSSAYGTANIALNDGAADFLVSASCTVIGFDRSHFSGSPREQPNQLTAFIDASFIYGSDSTRAAALRSNVNGKLLMSTGTGPGRQLLPFNFAVDPLENAGGTSTSLFISGDIRANEQVGLTAMHTLFAREHNRLCNQIKIEWPTATDEEIYQLARKIVYAEMQIITYNEWLPALMGQDAPSLADHAFSTSHDPSMLTEFTTAIFRFGHSLLQDKLTLGYTKLSTSSLPLRNAFFNPAFISSAPENVDLLIGGLLLDHAQEVDVLVTNEVRNFLFAMNGVTGCLDLPALNIQRGRDHGLSSYNAVRVAVGLTPRMSISEITSDTGLAAKIGSAYGGDISKVDLWVGALAEDHLPGSSLGELSTKIFQMQFERLRDGDPWFFLNDSDFDTADMKKVFDADKFSFAQLIRDNTDIPTVPDEVFKISTEDSEVCGSVGSVTMELT